MPHTSENRTIPFTSASRGLCLPLIILDIHMTDIAADIGSVTQAAITAIVLMVSPFQEILTFFSGQKKRVRYPCYNVCMKSRYSASIFGPSTCCHVCGRPDTEIHHVFFGPYRSKSEKWGMKTYLCETHHRCSTTGVHGGNTSLDRKLKAEAQALFERKYGHELFMSEFKRDYIAASSAEGEKRK